MASDALFQALAEAKSRPSQGFRTFQNAVGAAAAPLEGYQAGMQAKTQQLEATLKPYEIWAKIADSSSPNIADSIFEARGIPSPRKTMGATTAVSPSINPTTDLRKQYESGDIGNKQLDRGIKLQEAGNTYEQNRPRTLKEIQGTLAVSPLTPKERNEWITANIQPDNTFSNRSFDDLNKMLSSRTQSNRSGFYGQRAGQVTLGQLPSQMPQSTNAGAAAMVQMSARQGQSLIANPLVDPKRIGLAAGDMARTVLRAAPQLEAMKGADYANTVANKLNDWSQKLSSGEMDPKDIPKVRKQMYETFKDLRDAARPYISQHLANVEDTLPELPANWEKIKAREMGSDIPDIPFQETNLGAGEGSVWKTATGPNGIKLRTKDNWTTYEPVPQGQ